MAAKKQMEAGLKGKFRFHREKQHLDPNYLTARQADILCKEVMKRKMDEQGSISRKDKNFIANGYIQRDRVPYDEITAAVIPFDVLLSIVGKFTSLSWQVYHADIYTAFLNGHIDGELYVRWDKKCYKLKRILYGLKHSSILWHGKVKIALERFGFTQLELCKRVFKCNYDKHDVIMLVNMDDLLILRPELSGVKRAKAELKELIEVYRLEGLKYCLGVSFKPIGHMTFLSQSAYCSRTTERFGMDMPKTVSTPMVENINQLFLGPVSSEAEHKKEKEFLYRSLIESMLSPRYHTQLEITVWVGILSSFVKNPTTT